jgi:restriction system protein
LLDDQPALERGRWGIYSSGMTTAAPTEIWHYPPDLLELVVDAVARLNRGKEQEIDFFRGAGVPDQYLNDVARRVAIDKKGISKFEIARTVLVGLNEAGESMLGPRREILKRIVETESFEHCWENDRFAAKGVVAEIRAVVGTKDSFSRMKLERDKERDSYLAVKKKEHEERERDLAERAQVRTDLFALFGEKDPWKRGKQLEGVLNRLFALDGMSVREAFHLNGDEAEGIVEQIDGVIDLDGSLYLVEMKWLTDKVSPLELGLHHSRVFFRHAANGMFISASGFTEPAIAHTKLALTRMVSVLFELEEIVMLLERDADVRSYLREKVQAAITERQPLHRPVIT